MFTFCKNFALINLIFVNFVFFFMFLSKYLNPCLIFLKIQIDQLVCQTAVCGRQVITPPSCHVVEGD